MRKTLLTLSLNRLGEGCHVEPQGVSVCECIESNAIS